MGWEDDAVVTAAPEKAAWRMDQVVHAAPQYQPRAASNPWESFVSGMQGSGTALYGRGRLPDLVLDRSHASWYDKALEGAGSAVADVPLVVAGGVAGAIATLGRGGPMAAGAAGNALPTLVRESLVRAYERGDVDSSADWLTRTGIVIKGLGDPEIQAATAKAAAVGAATMGAGMFAQRLLQPGSVALARGLAGPVQPIAGSTVAGMAAAEIGTLAVAPAALEGRLPEPQDFANAAIVVGGMKTAAHMAGKMAQIWARTGVEPAQVAADAKADPKLAEDLKADTPDTPAPYRPLEAAENAKAAVREPGIKYPEQARAFADEFYVQHPQEPGGAKVQGYPNINILNVDGLDRINTVEDLAAMSASAAEKYRELYEAQRGGMSDRELISLGAQKLADILGTGNIDALTSRVPGTGAGALELWVRGQASMAFADHAKGLADSWDATKSSPEDTIKMMAAAERFAMTMAAFEGGKSEAGRAMRVAQLMSGGMNATVKKLLDEAIKEGSPEKIATAIKTMNDPAQVATFTRAAFEPKAMTTTAKIQSAWKAGLLSGTKIFQVKFIGDTIAIASNVVDKYLAAGVGLVTRSPDRILPSDVREYIAGVQGATRDTLKVFGAQWTKHGEQRGTGSPEGYQAIFGEQAAAGEPTVPPAKGSAADIANRVINIPGRIISSETEVAKVYNEQGFARYAAARDARAEGLTPGADDYNSRVAEIMRNPSIERMLEIEQAGREGTFTNKGGVIWELMHKIARNPVGGFIIPFDTVPSNLTKWAAVRIPGLAQMMDTVQEDFKAGGARRDIAIARQVIGGTVLLASYAAVKSGVLTGGGLFMTPQQREAQKETRQDNSITLGGKSYSITRFEPLSRIVQLAADVGEMMDHLADDDRASLPVMTALLFGHATISETYLSGMNNLIKALDDPNRSGPQYFDQLIGSAVPSLLAQIARANDTKERRIDKWFDAIQSRLPVFREEMLARINPLTGEPLPSSSDLTPVDKKLLSTDKVLTEAKRLEIGASKAPKSIEVESFGDRKLGRLDLTPEQQNLFLTTSGKLAHTMLTKMVNSGRWDSLPDISKKKLFADVLKASREMGRDVAVPAEQRAAKMRDIATKIKEQIDRMPTEH